MRLERTEDGFQIDAGALGPMLGVPAQDVQRLMREGRIVSLCETGQGADIGRHRITLRHGARRVRLTVNDAGDVLLRTRNTVAPRLTARPSVGPDSHRGTEFAGTAADLTHWLESRVHVRHRQRLSQARKLAEMVEDLHEDDAGVPAGLHPVLCRIDALLEAHMQRAENVIFPAIRNGETAAIGNRLDALRGDHARLQADCARIRAVCRNFELPDAACTSWATLYAALAGFVDDLAEQLRLETDVLFQRVMSDDSVER